jgi:hypothetical protein
VTGLGTDWGEAGAAVKQCYVYSARVRGIEVNHAIIQFPQGRRLKQALENKGIFHFGQADDIRKPAFLRPGPQKAFCYGVALGLESLFGPVPGTPGREFFIRGAQGIIPVVEEVLKVPEQDPESVRGGRYQEQQRAPEGGQSIHIQR